MRIIHVCRREADRKEEEVLYFREGDHVFTRRTVLGIPVRRVANARCTPLRSKRTSRLSNHPLSLNVASPFEIQSGFSDHADAKFRRFFIIIWRRKYLSVLFYAFLKMRSDFCNFFWLKIYKWKRL